jgi:lipopolysaccharide export system permease protein
MVIPLSGFGLNRTDTEIMRSGHEMMNLKQLIGTCDSLQQDIGTENKSLYSELTTQLYFQEKNIQLKFGNGATRKNLDTIILLNPVVLFDSLPKHLQKTSYDMGMANAKNVLQSIRRVNLQQDYKVMNLRNHRIQLHEKFTLSFACFIFFFIGAPLGAIIRKGGLGTPIVVSVLFFLAYYIMSLTGKKLVREGIVNDIPGMWAPSLILLLIGIFITYKATTDSVIMNMDTYSRFFRQILAIVKPKKS